MILFTPEFDDRDGVEEARLGDNGLLLPQVVGDAKLVLLLLAFPLESLAVGYQTVLPSARSPVGHNTDRLT